MLYGETQILKDWNALNYGPNLIFRGRQPAWWKIIKDKILTPDGNRELKDEIISQVNVNYKMFNKKMLWRHL